MKNTELIDINEPIEVQYFESFADSTLKPKFGKSASQRTRIYMSCHPYPHADDESLSTCIERNGKRTNRKLSDDIIACVPITIPGNPNYESENFLLDRTEGGIPSDIRDAVSAGFKAAIACGPMINAPIVEGIFYIDRLAINPDCPVSREIAMIGTVIKYLTHGLILNSDPIIHEPIYSFSISISNESYSEFQKAIFSARGHIDEEEICGKNVKVNGFIPGAEITKIKGALQSVSQAAAPVDIKISHYAIVPGSLKKETSPMGQVIIKTRNDYKIHTQLDADSYFDLS